MAGSRSTMPSSDQIGWTSMPVRSRRRASMASAHGAWTRAPNGDQQADAPVAQLIPEPLEHDRAVRGQRAGGVLLLLQVGEQVGRGEIVQVVLLPQARDRRLPARLALGRLLRDLAREAAQLPTQLHRAAHPVALPERDLAGLARGRRDRDPVMPDRLDAPRRRTQQDDLARARLVDHLLVQLAHAPAARPRGPGARAGSRVRVRRRVIREVDREQAAVRDRAAGGDRHGPRVPSCLDRVRRRGPR